MSDICFCLGKLKLKEDRNWYIPTEEMVTYCEPCFKRYPKKMRSIQFNTIYGKHFCNWDCEEFKSFSTMIYGMRISIVHPQTLYRYTSEIIGSNSIKVKIPNDFPYMLVIENYDKFADTRINIENIMFGKQHNVFDTYSTKNKLIIPFMSYSSDLLFDENNGENNVITFRLNKWIKCNEYEYSYYGLYKEVNFTIELVRDDRESDKMYDLIDNYVLFDKSKKIIIVEDFI